MFKKNNHENPKLDSAIDEALTDLSPYDEEYLDKVKALDTLYKLKEISSPKRVSPDTLVIVAGNLLGIALIIRHENVNVVTSKALGFVMKAR